MPKCTYCGGTEWYEGPSGGMSTNILCANKNCRHWFNFTPMLDTLDDLKRIEPTDEEKKAQQVATIDKVKMDADARVQEGRNAYLLGERIGPCAGSGGNGGFYNEAKDQTNIRRSMAYGGNAEPVHNIDRLCGYIEAMADELRELKAKMR